MAGIYIHIPFCKQACHYCDFYFSTNTSIRDVLVESIAQELTFQREYLGDEVIKTIYFGGGTPSLLTEQELTLIFNALHRFFKIDVHSEITLEANPDDLTESRLSFLKQVGINRLSIGIQSFDNKVLQFINRAHNAEAAVESFKKAREYNFDNISIDLIYGIPGQDNAAWKKNIEQALDLKPEHISSYSLTIEEKTVFGNWASKGKLSPVDDDIVAAQLEILVGELERAGYEQYEVSNFSLAGFESKHNSSYWRQEKYLGIGPSAHSYNGITRQFNVSNNHLYVKAIQEGRIPFELETLSREDHINEYLLTTLRTSWGSNLEELKQKFGYDIVNTHREYIEQIIHKQLAQIVGEHLKLTKTGKLLADKIASDLFLI